MKNEATFAHDSNETCLAAVLEVYEAMKMGLTLRHYWYRLLGEHIQVDENNPKSKLNGYKFVSRLLTDARRSGLLPWDAVIDPGRRSIGGWYGRHSSLEDYAKSASRSGYSVDVWRGQPYRIDIWVEKDAIAEFVYKIVSNLRVAIHVAKGYGSATVVADAARRYGTGEGWAIVYCGDFDPSGLDIQRSLQDELAEFGAHPTMVRATLTQEDTESFPEYHRLETKPGDSRTKKFQEKYGMDQKCYEVDVMDPSAFKEKLLDTIYSLMDVDAFNEAIKLENIVDREAEKILKVMLNFPYEMMANGAPGCTLPLIEQWRYLLTPEEYQKKRQETV